MIKPTGIEFLRCAVNAFSCCNESFLQRFSPDELTRIYCAWLDSGWDIPADQWEERQVKEAINGIVPQWDVFEKPIYDTPKYARWDRLSCRQNSRARQLNTETGND